MEGFLFFYQLRKQHVQILMRAGCTPWPVCLTEAEPSIYATIRTWGHQCLAFQYFSCQYDMFVINKFTDSDFFQHNRLGVLRRESWPGHLWATCCADSNEMWDAGLLPQVRHLKCWAHLNPPIPKRIHRHVCQVNQREDADFEAHYQREIWGFVGGQSMMIPGTHRILLSLSLSLPPFTNSAGSWPASRRWQKGNQDQGLANQIKGLVNWFFVHISIKWHIPFIFLWWYNDTIRTRWWYIVSHVLLSIKTLEDI